MDLVIITTNQRKGLLEDGSVKFILAPFEPSPSRAPLCLDTKCYHYIAIDDEAPLEGIIKALMQIDGVESVYQKPLDFPPKY